MGMQAFASYLELHPTHGMSPAEATAMKLTAQRWHASTSKVGAGRRQDVNLFVTHAAGAAAYCTHPPVLVLRRHDLFVDYTVV